MGYLLLLILFAMGFASQAQTSVSVASGVPEKTSQRQVVRTKSSIRLKHPYDDYFDQKVLEYKKRMEANAKKYRKMARAMKKPQYSDPTYFGHKRKPKKRPPGKRKFCKECEIVH